MFSSNLAHLSLVFFWLAGMELRYLFERSIGQDILNSQLGIRITSGIFQLWRSQGIITQIHLKYGCTASLIGTILSLAASSFHIHMSPKIQQADSFFKKFKSISSHHLAGLFGFGSLSWSAHQIHISFPFHALLDSGIDPAVIPCGYHVLFKDFWLARSHRQVGAHHFSIGIVFLPSSLLCQPRLFWFSTWHAQLSINLAIAASLSIAFSHHIYAIPIYPYLASDYPTLLSLFSHHMWIGGFFTIGAAAHASIFIIAFQNSSLQDFGPKLFLHRDLILGHLLWVSLALGFHSFSLYIHNDTFQAFGRSEDIFDDNSLQLYPLYTRWVQSFASSFDMKILALQGKQDLKKLIKITQEFRTADFLVHHIHAFTIHTAFFIFSKAILYARSSRLVSDKFQLGFRYPCDGPGRGGTCQISPWDHIFLALFWMYNSLSVVLFHYFWKMQSDLWGISAGDDLQKIIHITAGDFSLHSSTIHGWLRNFLWSQSAQVIQSYTSSISGYGFIFIRAHNLR